jgi:flagellar protein FliT
MISVMPNQISLYEDMSKLSSLMVEAARSHDWDRLVSLEDAVTALRRSLEPQDDNSEFTVEEITRKRMLIQKILQDDAEVRRHTEPWMEHLRQFLGQNNIRKKVVRAYGAGF